MAPSRPTVLDATVLSNFASLDQIDRLETLQRPVVPPTVRRELEDGLETYPYLERVTQELAVTIPVVELGPAADSLATQFATRLDGGEAEALALAEARDGLVVTDDGAARDVARERGVRFTGTIGVLISLVENDRVARATADRWLKRLVDETDYRSPSRELSDVF